MMSTLSQIDKRTESRIECINDSDGLRLFIQPVGWRRFEGNVFNLSEGGVGFSCPLPVTPLTTGKQVQLIIYHCQKSLPIVLNGEIRSARDRGRRYGVCIKQVSRRALFESVVLQVGQSVGERRCKAA